MGAKAKRHDERPDTFRTLRSMLNGYRDRFAVRNAGQDRFELWTRKPAIVAGRERDEVYFAGLATHTAYVGFYFMPVYTNPELRSKLGRELGATLKGKSCFHIRTLDDTLLRQVRRALEIGVRQYHRNGWL